jgi:hypothetical protein
MSAYVDSIGDTTVTLHADDSSSRRSRGAQIGALKRWIESGQIGSVAYRLTNPRVTYSETHGFLSRTRITYDLVRY